MNRKTPEPDTLAKILDVAQELIQTRGYNAFSYADIAASLRITKASLHYHFRSKSDLGHSLIIRYEDRFRSALALVDAAGGSAPDKIRSFVSIFSSVLADQRMCLCGMLASEFHTLPQPMQGALDHFFELIETWLSGVLEEGRDQGLLAFDGSALEMAQFLVAALEGAMMLSRAHGNDTRFTTAAKHLLADIGI
jgi:TetR/AcrR family transcriptional repressor of nem operon